MVDENPAHGDNFYRIKSIDNSGKINYSEVVKVSIKSIEKNITVFPNPVHANAINVYYKNMDKGNYRVSLMNSSGQTVYAGNILHAGGSDYKTIKLNSVLPSGVYRLKLTHGEKSEKISVFIQ